MTLLDVDEGSAATVVALKGGKKIADRLNTFGVRVGHQVRLVKTAPFKGPVLVEDTRNGARFMIARDIAKCVEIEHADLQLR